MRAPTRRGFILGSAALAAAAAWGGRSQAQPGPGGPAAPKAGSKTRLILLGTRGGPRVTPQFHRAHPSQVILANGVPYVIDCGSGVADRLVLAGVSLTQLPHIFITHHHSDHNLDYGNLFLLAWASGLRTRVDTWGPPPIANMTRLAFELNRYDIDVR